MEFLGEACRREHLVSMAVDPHIAPDFDDLAIGIDQNCCPSNPHERLAVHRFFAPDAIGLQHSKLFIGNERNRKFVFVAKLFLCGDRVSRDAKNGSPCFRKGIGESAEGYGLKGASRRVGAWIEEDHQFAAGVVRQRYRLSAVAG